MSAYQQIPTETAKQIADAFDKSIVIICAHDPEHGLLHITTYGHTPQDKEWAAAGGEIVTQALGGIPSQAIHFEDYRLQQARFLLSSLKRVIGFVPSGDPMLEETRQVILRAEEFLG